ncbi:hypothetical protein BH11ARM2_BH11ARM2_28860 [soil metagenome]
MFRLAPSGPFTGASGSSSLLPTPLASERLTERPLGKNARLGRDRYGKPRVELPDGTTFSVRLGQMAALGEWPDGPREPGPLNPAWVEWLMGFPDGWTG